jgi:hypothetical protein
MADVTAYVADEDLDDDASLPSTCVLDDTPVAYRSARRRFGQMVTWALRSEEHQLRSRRPDLGRLEWVRLFAMRHVLEDRGVEVPEL